jgi:hypothetical protein
MTGLFTTLKVSVTVGSANPDTYYFKGRADLATADLAIITGVSVAPDIEQNRPCVKVEELLGKGILVRMATRYGSGTAPKTALLLCSRNKIVVAFDQLIGAPLRGGLVLSASIRRKATFI